MLIRSLCNLLSSKDVRAQLKINKIMKHQGALIFYHTAIETGLLKLLAAPSAPDEIARALGIKNPQLLSSLLDLGCSLGEISRRNGTFRLKGAAAKALARNIPLMELIRETVQYHGDVAVKLGAYLMQNTKGEYLDRFGGVIAESSRIMEPFIRAFIYHEVKKTTPLTILEFGCGSGEYLKYYVDINRNNGGVAMDIDASAVEIARKKIREHRLEGNFTVIQENILNPAALRGASFDLVTSFSNMHYFSREERVRFFRTIRSLLNDNGRLMLATGFKAPDLASSYYDLIFLATRGLHPLPHVKDVTCDLMECRFTKVKTVSLFGRAFVGVVGWR